MTDDEDAVVTIAASVRARALRIDEKARTEITTRGRGRVVTHRRGLPPEGAVEGTTYSDVEASIEVASDGSAHARAKRPP